MLNKNINLKMGMMASLMICYRKLLEIHLITRVTLWKSGELQTDIPIPSNTKQKDFYFFHYHQSVDRTLPNFSIFLSLEWSFTKCLILWNTPLCLEV